MEDTTEKIPHGKEILNPLIPDATWDVSGLFTFDDQFTEILNAGRDLHDCEIPIRSIHGCFPVMWNGGRVVDVNTPVLGDKNTSGPELVLKHWSECPVPVGCFYTFSNHLLKEEHLDDPSSNWLLDILVKYNQQKVNGVIIATDILSDYIRKKYPELKQKASIVKSSVERPKVFGRDFKYYDELTKRFDIIMLHPDDGHDKELLKQIADSGKQDSYEIILNENCPIGCNVRKPCYATTARDGIEGWHGMFHFFSPQQEYGASATGQDLRCGRNNYTHPDPKLRTTKRSCNLTQDELAEVYNMGFRHFKLQGRDRSWNAMYNDFVRYALDPDHLVTWKEWL